MNYHCLFEQSGTFKNVLKSKGHNAYDYDIQNEFGETDFVVDLFNEIEKEYFRLLNGEYPYSAEKGTIFTNMTAENDFIIAFFPCTHFCYSNVFIYQLKHNGINELNGKNIKLLIERNRERAKFFEIYLKFIYICKMKGIPTIIENPAAGIENNFLKQYSPIRVAYYEKDRSLFGDNFKKPTNYFAINFDMKEKFTMFYDKKYEIKRIQKDAMGCTERSMISPVYAENFYKRFLEG